MRPNDAPGHPFRVAALAAVLTVGAVLLAWLGVAEPDRLQSVLDATGPAAPVVFVVATAAVTLLPVPRSALSVLAGAMFGLGAGFVLAWTASLIGALAGYAIGRVVDPSALEWITGRHHERARDLLERRGFAAVLWSRIIPVLPFTVANYLAGLAGVRARSYAIGTAVGMVPGTVAYVAGGAFAGEVLALDDPALLVPLGLLTVVLAAIAVVLRWAPRRTSPAEGLESLPS